MLAIDIMTAPVVTVAPEATVAQIATLLLERRISAVPVLEGGRLVGIVSEGDLLHRQEIGTDRTPPGSWWLRLFGHDHSVEDYVKSHARQARDIMTREVVCVTPETPVAEVANLLDVKGIKRVPVLDGGQLVGIVSRSNLVQALASQARPPAPAAAAGDDAIHAALLAELESQPWWRSTFSMVSVTDGVVRYRGTIDHEAQRLPARIAAENVPGVRRVEDLRIRFNELPMSV
jgi:CBS domain-containing protein